MTDQDTFTVELDDGTRIAVAAEVIGGTLVADTGIFAKLGAVASSVEKVSHEMLEAVRRAGPDKATVELGFGIAVEAGQLVALFGKGKGEASVTVTLEWSRDGSPQRPDTPAIAPPALAGQS